METRFGQKSPLVAGVISITVFGAAQGLEPENPLHTPSVSVSARGADTKGTKRHGPEASRWQRKRPLPGRK